MEDIQGFLYLIDTLERSDCMNPLLPIHIILSKKLTDLFSKLYSNVNLIVGLKLLQCGMQ